MLSVECAKSDVGTRSTCFDGEAYDHRRREMSTNSRYGEADRKSCNSNLQLSVSKHQRLEREGRTEGLYDLATTPYMS